MKVDYLVAIMGVSFFLGVLIAMAYPALKDLWKDLRHRVSHS